MAINIVNPKADYLRRIAALSANTNACKGLQEILRSNLGPRGTLKMLVGGAGQIKITKDGCVLLNDMQIQHPTASMVARAATALDEITGDGTTTNVLVIGEMMKLGERLVSEGGVHPHVLCEGIDIARKELLRWFDTDKECKHIKVPVHTLSSARVGGGDSGGEPDRELLMNVARTALRSKVHQKVAEHLTPAVVDAVLLISKSKHKGGGGSQSMKKVDGDEGDVAMTNGSTKRGEHDDEGERSTADKIDLFMIEVICMVHRLNTESRLVRGMVLDHGTRHQDMPDRLDKCYILTLNVSLEYEKSEVNSGFFYSNVEQREKLVTAERHFTDDKVRKIIQLKRDICGNRIDTTDTTGSRTSMSSGGQEFGFVLLNQKGIDPPALDMLAKEGIIALRRVKRRNMERLTLCCGGQAVNCVDDLRLSDCGYADEVYQQSIGDEKYTFVEGVRHPQACTILLQGPNEHTVTQMKDALRDGLRAVKNVLVDKCVIPGCGAFEIAAYDQLQKLKKTITGKAKLGVDILAESLLAIPRTLAENSGFDAQDTLLKLQEAYDKHSSTSTPIAVGLDVYTGEVTNPASDGIWDVYCVKKNMLSIAPALVQNLLQVDEVMRAGKAMGGGGPQGGP
eukprot:GHVQ01034381.1.p1 GENE.GHVQ01034381.1~~GHVQ01034381.1.p1  ORF type:complete len:623 (+),score=106.73 GHVQ01034381.1:436-2304(+)